MNNIFHRNRAISYALITIGTLILATAFEVCLSPNHVLVSGTGGIAFLVVHFIPVPLGAVYLVLNVPLFLIGWHEVGTSFLIRSIWGTISLSVFLVLLDHVPVWHHPIAGGIVGGIVSGLAVGLVLLAGGTTGGTDIVSVVVNRRSKWSVGHIMFAVNVFIVLAGGIVFGWCHALLTVASLLVTAGAVNLMLRLGGWKHSSSASVPSNV